MKKTLTALKFNFKRVCHTNNHIKEQCIMPSKSDIEYQIKELKMDYMNLQGDIEKLESTGHNDQVTQAEQRLANMEAKLAELNKQLAAL